MKKETLLRALSDIGEDLIHMAEKKKFTNQWKKWGALAACAAVVIGIGAAALTRLPMDGGVSKETPMLDADLEYAVSESVTEEEAAPAEPQEAPAADAAGTVVELKAKVHPTEEEVERAIEEGAYDLLLDTFVKPLAAQEVGDFLTGAGGVVTLDHEHLNRVFLSTLTLEDAEILQEGDKLVVAAEMMDQRLNEVLWDFDYDPAQTEAWDTQRNALVFDAAALSRQAGAWTMEYASYADKILFLRLLPPVEEQDPTATSQEWIMTIRYQGGSWYYMDFASVG